MKYLRSYVTLGVDCSGDTHQLSYDPGNQSMALHDHPAGTEEEINVNRALRALGKECPPCLRIFDAFEKNSLYFVREGDTCRLSVIHD
jgi:hypothetical protein